MFTQCPNCQKTYSLTWEQLRASRDKMRCECCSKIFDAMKYASETEIIVPTEAMSVEAMPTETSDIFFPGENKPSSSNNFFWETGVMAGALLLIVQAVYYETRDDNTPKTLSPPVLLEKQCLQSPCYVPASIISREFFLLKSSLEPVQDGSYALSLMFANRSAAEQEYPVIKLSLLDLNGKVFAERVFHSNDYLPKDLLHQTTEKTAMASQLMVAVNLKITAPATRVAGFTLNLIEDDFF